MISQISRSIVRGGLRSAASAYTLQWKPFSRLIPISGFGRWVIGQEMREVTLLAHHLNIKTGQPWVGIHGRKQAVFVGSHFDLLLSDSWFKTDHRLATAYFHGKPGEGVFEFDKCFENLTRKHQFVDRIQVSCNAMHEVVLGTGIDPHKVCLIPIGINPEFFKKQTPDSRMVTRAFFGIPQDAFVVGSFQKDGNGWGEGLEPKMIKGPDTFIETMRILKEKIGNVIVLLSGPARGYVKNGLKEIGVPYIHHQMEKYSDVGKMYQALDVYVVSSREEGGPKAVLESMASGIPLVTTRVGQAVDLVRHGENGFFADIEDAEGLALSVAHVFDNRDELKLMIAAGLETANRNCYEAQLPLWKQFFSGFVE